MSLLVKIKLIVACLSIFVSIISSSFTNRKSQLKEYGFISMRKVNDTISHFRIIDLAVLNDLNIDYGCRRDGYCCELSLAIDKANVIRSGKDKEIVDLDFMTSKVKFSGEGLQFFYKQN